MPDALFLLDDDTAVPTALATGPWMPDALHGGPVAALVCRVAERAPGTFEGGYLARLTVELMKPVPLRPLEVRTEVLRAGRTITVSEIDVRAEGTLVARAHALLVRAQLAVGDAGASEGSGPGGEPAAAGPAALPDPDELAPTAFQSDQVGFHTRGVDMRFVRGGLLGLGPSAVWMRLAVPVVAGEEPSGAQRAVALADFTNGISAVFPYERTIFSNADLTVHLVRPPVGEWIGLEAETTPGAPGLALAQSRLRDREGTIGQALQSLVVTPR